MRKLKGQKNLFQLAAFLINYYFSIRETNFFPDKLIEDKTHPPPGYRDPQKFGGKFWNKVIFFPFYSCPWVTSFEIPSNRDHLKNFFWRTNNPLPLFLSPKKNCENLCEGTLYKFILPKFQKIHKNPHIEQNPPQKYSNHSMGRKKPRFGNKSSTLATLR